MSKTYHKKILEWVSQRSYCRIKIRETKELACARLTRIVVSDYVLNDDQRLGLWMARLDVTEERGHYSFCECAQGFASLLRWKRGSQTCLDDRNYWHRIAGCQMLDGWRFLFLP
jgi:hypothetical protein